MPFRYDHGLIRTIGIVKLIGQATRGSIARPKCLLEVEDAR
ncbi:hypothetical protein OROHE_012354 [Orobanche hederae]